LGACGDGRLKGASTRSRGSFREFSHQRGLSARGVLAVAA